VIGLLGLAFKPNTDDMRESPAAHIARMLLTAGARVRGYDPVAMPVAARVLPEVELADDPYTLADGADALVLVTEWNEFKNLDFERMRLRMRQPVLVDGRGMYDPQRMQEAGFRYLGIGRGPAV
jgi:UDPglucose 6-dehydrogenase